jgi:hypothetical protein
MTAMLVSLVAAVLAMLVMAVENRGGNKDMRPIARKPAWLGAATIVLAAAMAQEAGAQQCSVGGVSWIDQFGSAASEEAWGVAVDGTRNVYAAGNTAGALPGQASAGGIDAFVRKYDPAGNEAWTRQFGTTGDDFAWDVTVDAVGNVYVAASVASGSARHAFLRKYDADGTELWTSEFGGVLADALSVAVDVGGFVYVAGDVFGSPFGQISAGSLDAFVRQYDSNGNTIWTRQFGTSDSDAARSVAVDAAGSVYLSGSVGGTLPGQTSTGGTDAFVRQYSAAGTEVWTRQFGTSSDDAPTGLAVDAAGNAFVTGGASGALPGQTWLGSYDVFLRKYDTAGNEMWTRQFGSPGWDLGYGVAVDNAGTAYVSGFVAGALPGQSFGGADDAFVRAYDPAGTSVFTKQFGSAVSDWATDVAADDGSLYLAGLTFGVLEGPHPGSNWDAFAAKLFLSDVEAPSLAVAVTPDTLWPPDHRMVPIAASLSVADACDPNPIVTLVSLTSNEPDEGLADGDTVNDIQIADPSTFLLRAERSAKGLGRIYTATYVASDADGNTSAPVTVTVAVPLN